MVRPRYLASRQHVMGIGDGQRVPWEVSRTACLGVSLDSPVFEGDKLHACLRWVARHFDDCVVLVGDSIHSYTIQILEGLGPEAAEDAALDRGSRYLRAHRRAFEEIPECRFRFLRCSEAAGDPRFPPHARAIAELHASSAEFAHLVAEQAAGFLERVAGRREPSQLELCRRYLLEEIAIFSFVVEHETPVFVYPGRELAPLRAIAMGRIPGAPRSLRDRVSVTLRFRGSPARGRALG